MTQQDISDVTLRLEKMMVNSARAIELSEQLTADSLSEDNHLYWALIKYVENVQESAKQINKINNRFFSELAEIDEDDWKALRGMRDWLAHKFWDVDPNILWKTVRKDFVNLLPLLVTIRVVDQLVAEKGEIDITGEAKHLMNLPDWPASSGFKPGHSLVIMAFTRIGNIMVIRIGQNDGHLVVVTDPHTKPELYTRPTPPDRT